MIPNGYVVEPSWQIEKQLSALLGIVGGNFYFVDPANGDDDNDGLSPSTAFATLAAAEDKCTANQNDTVVILADETGITLSTALVWDKNYTHLIGVCAPSHAGQRARIFQKSDLTGASPLIDIQASGCIFKNLYVFQGVADNTSLINVRVSGSRNYFENVHFAGGGHTTQAVDNGASLYINGGSENRFNHCTIGVDTVDAATGMAGLVFPATGGAARNKFEDCLFTMQAGNAGAIFVELLGNAGIDRYQIFDRCIFINLGTGMTQAFAVAAGFDPANKRVLLKDCALIGAADWDANNRGILYLNNGTITGGGNAGLFAVSNAT